MPDVPRSIMLLAIAAAVTGCASGKLSFQKAGVSQAQLNKDSAGCWNQAQVARQPDDVATAHAIGAFIGGGVAGVAGTMIGHAMTDSDPKNKYRRSAHLDCMQRKGYVGKGSFQPVAYTTKPKIEYEADEDDQNGIGMHHKRRKKRPQQTKSKSVATRSEALTTGSIGSEKKQ